MVGQRRNCKRSKKKANVPSMHTATMLGLANWISFVISLQVMESYQGISGDKGMKRGYGERGKHECHAQIYSSMSSFVLISDP